jgi:hypothetical protein
VKEDVGKIRYTLIPPDALRIVATILTQGAAEHGDHGWQSLKDAEDRYMNALYRHLEKFREGEINDPKSGMPHLGHVASNALLVLALFIRRKSV